MPVLIEKLRLALDLMSGFAAAGAGLGYALGLLKRFVLRRETALPVDVMHGAGIGFLAGAVAAILVLALS